MPSSLQLRSIARLATAGMILSSTMTIALSQPAPAHRAGAAFHAPVAQSRPTPAPGPEPKRNQEHLAQWMDRHSNLPLAEQQRALENEPGFRDLPPPTQQRMRDRLTQLNNMTPEQRQRILDRTEAMERLTLPQRQQVRSAMQQLGGLPEDRRRLVARAFRDLREMPQPQRQAILDSDRFRGQFSDQERSTLSNLLAVEPYLPVRRPNDGTTYGK